MGPHIPRWLQVCCPGLLTQITHCSSNRRHEGKASPTEREESLLGMARRLQRGHNHPVTLCPGSSEGFQNTRDQLDFLLDKSSSLIFPLSGISACCSRGSTAHPPDVTAHSYAKHFSASKPPLGSISSTDALCHHQQPKASLKSSHATPA